MNEKNQNLFTAYSFLAALTENQNDLYNSVYVPICKRALSAYSEKKKSYGSVNDIQDVIYEDFDIKIPTAFLRRLLKSVERSMSNKERASSNFVLYENGQQFSIGRYAFLDLEFKLRKGRREAAAVQLAFEDFLKDEQIPSNETPPFPEFLQKNNSRLASFFSGRKEIDEGSIDASYYHHVEFLRYIESGNHQLYSVVESMYLGSIVVSFLEADFEFDAKFTTEEIYFLDTPFILRFLDLQKEEDGKAAKELVDLIKSTGGILKVLSITIDELNGILDNSINYYNAKTPTTTINEACQRRGINKTHLIKLNGALENTLTHELGISIEIVGNQQKEKYVKSNDLRLLREQRMRSGTAEHDVLAYLYVREKRGGVVQSYQKAKIWFLTTNIGLLNFNRQTMPYQGVSEIVLPDALTSLLWLRNPAQLAGKVKRTGLSELIAATIGDEVVSKELISEFEATISSINGISKSDYTILLNSVAYESAKRIEKFINKATSDPSLAAIEAQKIIEKERRRRTNEQSRLKEANHTITQEREVSGELADKLAAIEADLIEFSNANQDLRLSREEDRTVIEQLKQQMSKREQASKRWLFSLLIFIVIIIVYLFSWQYWKLLKPVISWTWRAILGGGAAWSFLSFALNLYKSLKNK